MTDSDFWGVVGILLIIAVVIGLYWVFRTYGRQPSSSSFDRAAEYDIFKSSTVHITPPPTSPPPRPAPQPHPSAAHRHEWHGVAIEQRVTSGPTWVIQSCPLPGCGSVRRKAVDETA